MVENGCRAHRPGAAICITEGFKVAEEGTYEAVKKYLESE
jgi:hypothetical protein